MSIKNQDKIYFSENLDNIFKTKGLLKVNDLNNLLKEKGFLIFILILSAIPALPIPTGGITHVFEIIVMVLSIEIILGINKIWLPKKLLNKNLPKNLHNSKFLKNFIKIVRFFEKYSKPRFKRIVSNKVFLKFSALLILILTISAFLAPPFSGMDTLPSLAILLIVLGLIFEDLLISFIGVLTGSIGLGLIITFGKFVFNLFS